MVYEPPLRNWTIWVGNSGVTENADGIVFVYKEANVLADLNGRAFVFTVKGLPELRKTSADGGITVDPSTSKVTIPISVADSRLFQLNVAYAYEIEERFGTVQTTIMQGNFIVRGGNNDEAA